MPRMRYDRIELKQKFLTSDHVEVKAFLKEQLGSYTGTMRTQTSWWIKDKEKYKLWVIESARQEVIDKYKPKIEDLMVSLHAIMQLVKKQLQQMHNGKTDVSAAELERLRKIVKTELWEPTTIWVHEHTGKDGGAIQLEHMTDEELLQFIIKNTK